MCSFDPMRSTQSMRNQVVEVSTAKIVLASVIEESAAEVIKKTANIKVQNVYVIQKAVSEKECENPLKGITEERAGTVRVFMPLKDKLVKEAVEKNECGRLLRDNTEERAKTIRVFMPFKGRLPKEDTKKTSDKEEQAIHESQKENTVKEKECKKPLKKNNDKLVKEGVEKTTNKKLQEVWIQSQDKVALEKVVLRKTGQKYSKWSEEERKKLGPFIRHEQQLNEEACKKNFPGRTLNGVVSQMQRERATRPEYRGVFPKLYPVFTKKYSIIPQ